METAPPTTSASLSETAEPPPPVLGAPAGMAPPPLVELLEPPDDEPDELAAPLEPAAPPDLGAEVAAGVLVDFGAEVAAGVLVDFGAEVAEDEPLPEEEDEPDEEAPVSIFMPGGMLPMSVPDVLPVDEDEPDDETLLAGVGLAAGGRVTATVLPPLPPLAAALPVEAAGLAAAEASGDAVSVGAAVAAGEPAVEVVSFWDHRPIRDRTPARTAIAMIAPITQDVLLVSPSPVSSCSPGSLFGLAIFAPVAMVYAEIVGLRR
jgi:hypothetical protein